MNLSRALEELKATAKPPRCYIAGPMTGYPELNFPRFHAEAARYRALGWHIVNPAEINADPTAKWLNCMREDLKQLVDCDSILMLPGWEKSRGATLEHHVATALGMTIFYATDDSNLLLVSTDKALTPD